MLQPIMLQPRFWQLLFFGLLSSFIVYSTNFSGTVLPSSAINPHVGLQVDPGKFHVFISHGAGFLGSHIALALLEDGHAVTLVAEPPFSISHLYKLLANSGSRLKVLSCSLSDARQLQALLSSATPAIDAVVHLELSSEGPPEVKPLHLLANSTGHILSLLQAIDSSNVTKLVLSSSYSVYGKPNAYPVAESAASQPSNVRGYAAQFAEGAVRSYAASNPQFKAVMLRHASIMGSDLQGRLGNLFWPYVSSPSGLHSPTTDALASCLSAAAHGLEQQSYKLLVPNHSMRVEGEEVPCFKEYVHVSDLAAAYVAAISRAGNPPAVYNAGSGRPVTFTEVMEGCQTVLGVTAQVTEQVRSAEDCYGVAADITALQSDTSWRAQYGLEDALRHVLHTLGRADHLRQR